jgi:hypothetical protein
VAVPVQVVQRLDDVRARGDLVVRRDGVLEVEEDVVRGARDRLFEHLGVGAGDGELAALDARIGRGVLGMTHGAAALSL